MWVGRRATCGLPALGSVPIALTATRLIHPPRRETDHGGTVLVERCAMGGDRARCCHGWAASRGSMTGASSAGSCTDIAKDCAGARSRPSMARARRCSTGLTGGASVGCGRNSWPRCRPARSLPRSPWPTARRSARIARRRAQKGGTGPGDRSFPRRPDDQNPRALRWRGSPLRHNAHRR